MEMVHVERMNGKVKSERTERKPAKAARPNKSASYLRKVEKWGTRYVITACVLSSALNAWANVDMCGSESVIAMSAAGILGAVVPCLVWMLGHIAGNAYRAGKRGIAATVGAAGVALLVLSIWHCAHAITLLTGGGLLLSSLLAVGVDFGLIASEIAAVMASEC